MERDEVEVMRLMHGDCLEIMKEIPDGSVDLVLTDPPYGMSFQSHRRKEIYGKIRNDDGIEWLGELFDQCKRAMKDNTSIYVFCSWHNIDSFKQEFEKRFKLKNVIVWCKNNHGSGDLKAAYAPRYELVLYGHKGRRIFEEKRYDDVLFFDRTGNRNHPTEKPTDLLGLFVRNSTKEGESVLDPFMGSGSTGVACVDTGRDFIGIELDDGYFEIARKRIEDARREKDAKPF